MNKFIKHLPNLELKYFVSKIKYPWSCNIFAYCVNYLYNIISFHWLECICTLMSLLFVLLNF